MVKCEHRDNTSDSSDASSEAGSEQEWSVVGVNKVVGSKTSREACLPRIMSHNRETWEGRQFPANNEIATPIQSTKPQQRPVHLRHLQGIVESE